MDEDPINQFFPDQSEVDNLLYTTLGLDPTASSADISKAYRKLALLHHPDKHASATEEKKQEEGKIFQQVGYAYAVLRDETRRKRYDDTGRTDEGAFLSKGEEMGWEAYFAEVFDVIDRASLDNMKKAYQGSPDELKDLIEAYRAHSGSLEEISSAVPHSTYEDEPRFINLLNEAIKKGDIESTPTWKASSTDKKASKTRKVASEKEAKAAEELAKELGVWDEFYGSGKKTEGKSKRDAKGKAKKQTESNEPQAKDDQELDTLRALIQKKQANRAESLFASLEAKYGSEGSAEKPSKTKRTTNGKPKGAGSKGKSKVESALANEGSDGFEDVDDEDEQGTDEDEARPAKKTRSAPAAKASSSSKAGGKGKGKGRKK